MVEKVLRPLMKTATRQISALKNNGLLILSAQKMGVVLFAGMPWILCTNITGCWFWAHRICGLLNLSAQNLQVAKFERYESAGCQNWALKYNGLLNLSAQNSAVAQIWALKYNGLLNLCINLLIMGLNIPQTIRMSEHRQRCHECTVSADCWI